MSKCWDIIFPTVIPHMVVWVTTKNFELLKTKAQKLKHHTGKNFSKRMDDEGFFG
jgi:hypothetical protein